MKDSKKAKSNVKKCKIKKEKFVILFNVKEINAGSDGIFCNQFD